MKLPPAATLPRLPEIVLSIQTKPIQQKLQRINPHWSDQRISQAICDYRRFLALWTTDGPTISPSLDVEEAWRAHADLPQYNEDCLRLVGTFVPFRPSPPSGADVRFEISQQLHRCPSQPHLA